MNQDEKLKFIELKKTIQRLTAENEIIKKDAGKLLSTFESLEGELSGLKVGVNELKQANCGIWGIYFSKLAKNTRKKKRQALRVKP